MRGAAALTAAALLLLAGCSGGGGKLRVDAASSLTEVFRQLDPNAEFDFAGSDELAFQLEQGAKADVYASASPKYPDRLYREKLIERPRVFARNSRANVPVAPVRSCKLALMLERDLAHTTLPSPMEEAAILVTV